MTTEDPNLFSRIDNLPPNMRYALLSWLEDLRVRDEKAVKLAERMEEMSGVERWALLERCYGSRNPDEIIA